MKDYYEALYFLALVPIINHWLLLTNINDQFYERLIIDA